MIGHWIEDEVIVCSTCQGYGSRLEEVLVDYSSGRYETESRSCGDCKGCGRLLKRTTVSIEAFRPAAS